MCFKILYGTLLEMTASGQFPGSSCLFVCLIVNLMSHISLGRRETGETTI